MSVVPLMSALMPVPEPPPVTWICVSGFFFMNSSAQRWPRMTMVSEPLTVTGAAEAARRQPSARSAEDQRNRLFLDALTVSFC